MRRTSSLMLASVGATLALLLPISDAWASICGNGAKEPPEACDDGNTSNGDGCAANCIIEPNYTCSEPAAPWSFGANTPTGGAPGTLVPSWTVLPPGGPAFVATYETEEATCVGVAPGYISPDGWISVAADGCGAVSAGNHTFRATFSVTAGELAAGSILVGLGFDNRLADVVLNGVSLGISQMGSDGYTAPAVAVPLGAAQGVVAGINTLDIIVWEASGANNGSSNNTGIWARQLNPSVCVGTDTDGDGLTDLEEASIGTDPNDADSDDDGVIDGDETLPHDDTDGDGLINALDADSDDDGLFDGTEMGLGCANPATDTAAGTCTPDADAGATTTDPLDADTDNGGVSDGDEDANHNGAIDGGETNPNVGADDDTDGDGLTDLEEASIGTDPNDADSDDDGVIDGDETLPHDDTDGDGLINALDPDSDDDGLFDGTEMGLGCANPATDTATGHCIPDADAGATTTDPLDADTDNGGVADGDEDANHNGAIDAGETDPNDEADDVPTPTEGDADGDGVPDADDNCPAVANADQHDADGDGQGDACDATPNGPDPADPGDEHAIYTVGGGKCAADGGGASWMLGLVIALAAVARRRGGPTATTARERG